MSARGEGGAADGEGGRFDGGAEVAPSAFELTEPNRILALVSHRPLTVRHLVTTSTFTQTTIVESIVMFSTHRSVSLIFLCRIPCE